jgi:hypothetical protein
MADDGTQPQAAQDARDSFARRTQLSVDHDRDRLRTDDQRDAAYKDITGDDRPGSAERRRFNSGFGLAKGAGGL